MPSVRPVLTRQQIEQITLAQDGLITRAQALACGWSDKAILWEVRRGRWRKVFRGVYATFTGPFTWPVRVRAALLRAGPEAVVSHQSAAALHGLREPVDSEPIHVTVPVTRRVVAEPGLRIHYAHRLAESRHPTLDPPRTRVEDTVLDLVDTISSPSEVVDWVVRACQRRRTTPARLAKALQRRKKIKHRRLLLALIGDVAEGAESALELDYLNRVERAHGLPRATRQRRVAGRRVIWVDADLDAFALRIELDGRVGHVEEGAFRDRRRDNGATVGGKATLRYGAAEVFGTPCEVAVEVARVCRARGWRGRPRPCGPDCPVGLPSSPTS